MSGIDWSSTQSEVEEESERYDERVESRAEMVQALARGGMDGVQVISLESAEKVLTPKRGELIQKLRTWQVESIRDLARRLERDKAQVSRDLGILAEHGIIQYEENGRAKRPTLVQDHIVVEPI